MTPQIHENNGTSSSSLPEDALNNDSNCSTSASDSNCSNTKKSNNISTIKDCDDNCNGQGYVNRSFEANENGLTTSTADTLKIVNGNGIASAGDIGGLDLNQKSEKSKLEPTIEDFDDFLPHVGDFGRYQKILFLCMIPFAFFVAFVYFSQIFISLVPEKHWCHVPELSNLSVEERLALSIPMQNDEYSQCSMYDVNYTEILATNNGTIIKADPNWPIIPCKYGWDYNFTDVPYETIATQFDWVCENSALPTYAQSIFFVGAIFGGLLFGWMADRFGRIPALIGTNLVGFSAGVGTAFVNSFWQFALCRFLVGFAFDNCFTMMYILVLEYVGPKWRTFVANMSIAIFFTCASCALPWIALYVADWKLFAIITSAPLILAIFTPFIVPESARWLVSQGKIEAAIKILKNFERVNGKKVKPELYKEFSDSCSRMQYEENSHNNYSILDLFKTPRLRKCTILLILIWMTISLVFDGHVRNVGSLGLDLFLTFTVACATEFPADTFLTLTLDRWGRRWLAFGTMVASGVFSLLATTVPLGPTYATFAIIGRFSINVSYNIGLQYAAEILPTVVRAQGVAFIHIMGYVASIIAPFIVYLANIDPTLPLIILGFLGIIGGILALFLPETLGHELPQTLNDGEEFGRGQSMWNFPCIKNKKIHDDDVNDIEKNTKQIDHFRRSSARASLKASTGAEVRSSMLYRSKKGKSN